MRRYRSLPVEVDAVQFTGDPGAPGLAGLGLGEAFDPWLGGVVLTVSTPVGVMRARVGDWIIRGIRGELYPCPDVVFRMKYVPADGVPGE